MGFYFIQSYDFFFLILVIQWIYEGHISKEEECMKRTIKSQTVEVTRKIVGERLGKLRCDNNLTQEGLAEIMDVSRLTVYKWESGKNWPTPPHLAKLAELYECSMDYLVLGIEDRGRDNEEDQIGLSLLNRISNMIKGYVLYAHALFVYPWLMSIL